VNKLAVLEAAHPFGWQRDMMRPITLEVGARDLALAPGHRFVRFAAGPRLTDGAGGSLPGVPLGLGCLGMGTGIKL
jgi:hypothetical protein